MRVSVLTAPGAVSLVERPEPEPAADEVLVRVGSVGICGSDVHYYDHGRIGPYVVRGPLVLGHEASGVVTAVGAGVDAARVGQRVAVEPGVPCRRCDQCKHGRYNLCPDVRFMATPPVDGAFAELVTVPADFAHPVPDHLSDDAAALVEPLSVGVWACRKAAVGVGSRVLVCGAGPVGLLTVQVARAQGATEVVCTDISPERLAMAGACGATRTVDVTAGAGTLTGLEVDAAIECSGAASSVLTALHAVRPAGTVVLVGMGSDEVAVPLSLLQHREIVLTGTFRYANTYPAAIALAAGGAISLDELVTGRFGLAQVEEALRSTRAPGTVKSIVRPGE
ncbi:NAD(P)-dependent alcohol dehydrogenase [Ornithinimicrobium sediminis]|uniref:NAD(P)-dependent alcohol dehydrogenase n=1 Tax=Ornithinimicrobium sediminis TaxID=2904603 RepID=UPI0038CD9C68